MDVVPADFYDEEYFTAGTKSNYAPYGPGDWADGLADMIVAYDHPGSVLEAACAYGYLVEALRARGVDARGFDISAYAIGRAHARGLGDVTEIADASEPLTWPDGTVDLFVASELGEHLTPAQASAMLSGARDVAKRALLLIAMYPDDTSIDKINDAIGAEKDKSHINLASVGWWTEQARAAGWTPIIDERFNDDARSRRMEWSGRFFYLARTE